MSAAQSSTTTTPAGAGGAAGQPPFYQLYRKSSYVSLRVRLWLVLLAHSSMCRLGNALFESLDELIQSGHINPQLAVKVLNQFDKAASLTLASQLKTKCSAKGKMSTYRLVDDVWTFVLNNPTFKLDNNSETVGPLPGKCKIVACKSTEGGK
ncbi:hypothetical protein MNV49_007763 [Pseudohyphozyma bogoriensis]|nr:hypothetical protein MNV49_007763 [Pseudohyphozyma bogoriensis]